MQLRPTPTSRSTPKKSTPTPGATDERTYFLEGVFLCSFFKNATAQSKEDKRLPWDSGRQTQSPVNDPQTIAYYDHSAIAGLLI